MEAEFKKLYYSISEVSKITGIEQHTLRYWENEFPMLKPAKNRAGNRIYTNKDIALIIKIKKLVKEEKYTFEGARKVLEDERIVPVVTQKKRTKKRTLAKAFLNEEEDDFRREEKFLRKKQKKTPTIQEDLLAIKDFLLFLRTKID